jgi:DNA polymerase-3 subunit delta
MIIFLYGADTFRSRRQLQKMIAKFVAERDPQKLNVAVLDCEKEAEAKIREQLYLTPFLAEKRLVVLENLLVSKLEDLQKEILEKIKKDSPTESTNLIVWEVGNEFKGKTAQNLASELKKQKFSQEFETYQGAKLRAWLNQEIKEGGGKIAAPALNYLAENVTDPWHLHTLLDELLAYKNGEEITLPDVNLFIEEKTDDNIFNLVDAIIGKQPKKVYAQIKEQYRSDKDPLYLLAMISRQIKILLELRDEFERQESQNSDALAKKLGLHPFVVKKSLPLIKRYTLAELKGLYGQLLELDTQIKTGQERPELLLDIFVGKLTS